jgi:ribosomal subunit interface protein
MDVTFKGRHTSVPERFRKHAAAKLTKLERLDQKAIRIDVEVSKERNPRQSDRSERVELTIRSRGPAIRAEAAADDRYAALDLAFAKLEARLRRAAERRKARRTDVSIRSADALAAVAAAQAAPGSLEGESSPPQAAGAVVPEGRGRSGAGRVNGRHRGSRPQSIVNLPDIPGTSGMTDGTPTDVPASAPTLSDVRADDTIDGQEPLSGLVPIQMEGDGPLVVREKFHESHAMTIDQALLEMELVGHDFYAFHDKECGKFSVVYRRRGYDYGVIRLIEE